MSLITGPVPIKAKTDVIWDGYDSLSLGYGSSDPDPTVDDYDPGKGANAFAAHAINAELQRRAAPAAGFRAGKNTTWAKPQRIKWKQRGVSGSNIAQLLAGTFGSLHDRMLVYNPTVAILGCSPNDWGNAGYGTYLDTLWATLKPLGVALVLVSSVMGVGEKVQAGSSAWGLNSSDATLLNLNNAAKAWCTTNGVIGDRQGPYWIDIRGTTVNDPNTFAYHENIWNTGNVSTGCFTVDGEHPWYFTLSPGRPTGQQIYSSCLLANLNVDYT